jgi:hypothetical protein
MLYTRTRIKIIWIVWLLGRQETKSSTEDVKYKYVESSGIYYENLREVTLSNTEWKTVVYLHLNYMDQESGRIEQYVDHINKLFDDTNQELDRL